MLRIILGFAFLWLLSYGVYFVSFKTTRSTKMKIGKAVLVTTCVTLLACAAAFVITAL